MVTGDYGAQPSPPALLEGSWQATVFLGVLTLILGLIVSFHPTGSLNVLAVLLGVLMILSGIFHLIRVFDPNEPHRVWLGVAGLLFIVIGGHHLQHRGVRRHHTGQPVRPARGDRSNGPGPAGAGPGHPRVRRGRATRQAADAPGHRAGYPGRAATTAQRWYVVTAWRISPNAVEQSDTGGRSSRQAGRGDGSRDPSGA